MIQIIRRGKVSDRGCESSTERNRRRKAAEKASREALERLFEGGEGGSLWGAIEIAQSANLPWRTVACALRRMAARGEIIEKVVYYRSPWRSREQTRVYGLAKTCNACGTGWWLVNFA